MTFKDLNIIPEIIRAIEEEGYTKPSPIQESAIPLLLEGHDLLGSAQTGTGKTAAFAIPILQHIYQKSKKGLRAPLSALVLAPTRELAEQIKDSFITYSKYLSLKIGAIYGGVSQKPQERMIEKGIDILIATPGRLIDLINQKIVNVTNTEILVLDEADMMLDMGFIKDVRYINKLLHNKTQTLLFSATISLEIRNLGSELLSSPRYLEMAPEKIMLDTISHYLVNVEKEQKRDTLINLLADKKLSSVLIFTKTKHGANKLATFLHSYGVKSDAIHSNKSQTSRQKALNDFKARKIRCLVATDIAARGIDIHELSHVINFDVPLTPETYIHRIGRTGRAGFNGSAITFASASDKFFIKQIIKQTNLNLIILDIKEPSVEDKLTKDESFVEPVKPNYMEMKKQKDNQAKSTYKKHKKKTKIDPLLAEAYREERKTKTKYKHHFSSNNPAKKSPSQKPKR